MNHSRAEVLMAGAEIEATRWYKKIVTIEI